MMLYALIKGWHIYVHVILHASAYAFAVYVYACVWIDMASALKGPLGSVISW